MKIKNLITVILTATIVFGFGVYSFFKPHDQYSNSERRNLAEFPELSSTTILDGSFMKNFESYSLDQFPFRDVFRGVKAFSEENIFHKKDNNNVFKTEGHLSKIEYPINYNSLDKVIKKFNSINEKCFDETNNIYFTIVPDKNYYLAEDNGYLHIDYNEFIDYLRSNTEYMEYIDLTHTLDADDYYYTDTHWRQEKIIDTAELLASKLNVELCSDFTVNTLNIPFNGVYCGQYALPVKPDTIKYLTNDIINNFKVNTLIEKNEQVKYYNTEVYDMNNANSKDPYRMFLSGETIIQTIENPMAENDRHLIIFRDSFGSSMAPILAQGYAKTTLIDLRYVSSGFLPSLVKFENADILFMYSPLVLNTYSFKP